LDLRQRIDFVTISSFPLRIQWCPLLAVL